jgi:UDP-N-acetylmuramate dehydrogenase
MAGMIAEQELRTKLRQFWAGEIRWRAPLAEFTTLRVGGPAQALVMPAEADEIVRLINGCRGADIPWCVVGGGSNLLVADAGFAGLAIVLGRGYAGIRITGRDDAGRTLVEVEAGCRLAKLLTWCRDQGLAGLEFAVGIPGTVGGAIVMNAGAWGREIKDVLVSLTWLAGAGAVVGKERAAIAFAYRSWHGPADAVILAATFAFAPGDGVEIGRICREHAEARRVKQPTAPGLAGSFFKNPGGAAAGRLIEEAGLKGARVGGAEVSTVHANFIVNTGNATAADIIALMKLVRDRVRDVHGVRLEPEVRLLGIDRGGIFDEK